MEAEKTRQRDCVVVGGERWLAVGGPVLVEVGLVSTP